MKTKRIIPPKSTTLLELILAIVLLSVVVLAVTSIDLFSRHHVINASRRAAAQNEASFVLEHMTKEISKAIGNTIVDGVGGIIVTKPPGTGETAGRLDVYIDSDGAGGPGDGKRDPEAAEKDDWVTYLYYTTPESGTNQGQILYYSYKGFETVAQNISAFSATVKDNEQNWVELEVTACWDTKLANDSCGSNTNPEVTMSTRVKMPMVSTH